MVGSWIAIPVLPLVVEPWLLLSRWVHEPPSLQHALLIEIAANTLAQIIITVVCIVYIRRQRRKLRDVQTLLAESPDPPPDR